jgi:hypothetical protein
VGAQRCLGRAKCLRACEDAAPLVEWHLSANKLIPSSLGPAMRASPLFRHGRAQRDVAPHKLFIPAAACIKGAAEMSEPSPSLPKPRSIRRSAVSGGETLRNARKMERSLSSSARVAFHHGLRIDPLTQRTKTSINPSARYPPPATLMNSLGSLARSNSRLAKFIGMTRSSSP